MRITPPTSCCVNTDPQLSGHLPPLLCKSPFVYSSALEQYNIENYFKLHVLFKSYADLKCWIANIYLSDIE